MSSSRWLGSVPTSFIQLFSSSKLVLSLGLLLLVGIISSPIDGDGNSIFLASGNLLNVLRQVSITGILAVGMTLVILTGGIDLAVGSVMAFGATLCAMLLTLDDVHNGMTVASVSMGLLVTLACFALSGLWFKDGAFSAVKKLFLAASAGLGCSYFLYQFISTGPAIVLIIMALTMAVGAVLGAISGSLVTFGRMQAFIATLAMMVGALGGARLMAGQDRSVFPIYSGMNADESFDVLRDSIWGVPVPGLIFLAVVVFFTLLLRYFRFGRYLYAIGGNERAAFLSGIPVTRVKIMAYTCSGALACLAGILYCAQYRQGKPDAGMGMELDAIAAVVIGGANLMGGRGTVPGTLVGVLIFGFLSNILQLNNVDSNTQLLLKGIIIVMAVLVQEGRWGEMTVAIKQYFRGSNNGF